VLKAQMLQLLDRSAVGKRLKREPYGARDVTEGDREGEIVNAIFYRSGLYTLRPSFT
jgi:hypothetical protein